ncbi:MAG: FG-GAP-like repeat-containing protein [Desulfuromonadales bacterium]
MPRLLITLFAVIVLTSPFTLHPSHAATTWQSIGPFGGTVYTIAIDRSNPQTLYAGTWGGGVFKSTNGGSSWSAINSGLTKSTINALAIDPSTPQTVYAGTWGGGVFKSTNGGSSWSAVNSGLTNSNVSSLALDPSTPQTVYAGTSGGGVFKSTNGGSSWSAVNSGLTNSYVRSLAIDPSTPQTVYAGTNGASVFKTIDTSAPTITSSATATFTVGTPGSYTLTADAFPKPTFSVSGTLPAGLAFDPSTGILSGTPASGTAGAYTIIFTASNGVPPDATRGVTLTVLPGIPLSVAITPLPPKTNTLPGISGTASGTGLARVEVQITDGIYYLQANNSFSTTPAWLTASGTTTWNLNTAGVLWVDGITYSIFARASDGTTPTQPVKATVKILPASSKAGTALSLSFTPDTLKSGETTTASGQIMRIPDDGSSMAGLTVNLIVTPPSTAADPTPSPVIIPMTTAAAGSFTSAPLTTTFTTPGVYVTQARFDGNGALAAYATLSQPFYVNIQSGYAILITGKASNNDLIDQHTATINAINAALKKRGFLDTNIARLKSSTTASVTKQQIHDYITSWARDMIAAAPAPLYIVMIDHGYPDGSFVLDSARLTPDDLKSYLDTLEADPAVAASGALTNFNRFIIIGSCYSGAFIPKLSKPGRIIITSATEKEQSLAGVYTYNINSSVLYSGEYFVDTLFAFLGRGDTFKDAFTTATSALMIRDPRAPVLPEAYYYGSIDTLPQHPLLDDNGDGLPSYLLGSTDGLLASSLTLGEGIRVNATGNPADIANVAPVDILAATTTTKQLRLTANVNSRVGRAWVEIRRPGSLTTGGGSGQSIPIFDSIPLIWDGANWIGSYSAFDIPGTYDIYYYTKDNQTLEISPTLHSRVYKQQTGNTIPTPFNLLSPGDWAAPAPIFPLSWEESTDPDGLTYTLVVATDQNYGNIIYREENLQKTTTFMPKNALKDPASVSGGYYCQSGDSYCYWKVLAIDSYGAIRESSQSWRFTINPTNQIPYYLTGQVISSTTNLPLAYVNIAVTSSTSSSTLTANTKGDGSYTITLSSPGTYTVTVTYPAYQTRTISQSLTTPGPTTLNITLSAGTTPPPATTPASITWKHQSDGTAYGMTTDGTKITSGAQFWQEPNQTWQIVGQGDFDGDGIRDFVWQNNSTGQVYLMLMATPTTVKSGALIYTEPNTNWKIVATGDINGDGKTDLIWWNQLTGQVYAMLVNGTTIASGALIYTEPNTNWKIVAAADFNGNGKAELLWWNSATGQAALGQTNGTSASTATGIWSEPDTNWKIAGAGDLDGDGKADIIWHNRTTGQIYGMQTNGSSVTNGAIMYTEPNTTWEIVSIGSYTADSKADILWWNQQTGQVYLMPMNGLSVASGGTLLYTEPDTTWRIQGETEWRDNLYGRGVTTTTK